MKTLTKEQSRELRRIFLDGHGLSCPFCDSDDLETLSTDWNYDLYEAYVHCLDCDEHWTEVYILTLSDVVFDREEDYSKQIRESEDV